MLLNESCDRVVLKVTANGESIAREAVSRWILQNRYSAAAVNQLLGHHGETFDLNTGGFPEYDIGLYYYYEITKNQAGDLSRVIKLHQVR